MNFVRESTKRRWKNQIRRTASEINDRKDFSFIDRYIKDKRIILLGENSHGIADFFTTKIELIRYLHQHHGFNVVVLESGMLEATLCKKFLKDYTPNQQIKNCLLDIYDNEEMEPLFDEEWAQSIKVSGMDPQPTYPLISEYMLNWLNNHTDNELYESVKVVERNFFDLDDEIMIKITKSLKVKMKLAIKEYEGLLNLIDMKREIYIDPELQRMLQLIQQGMRNRLKWLQVNLKGYLSSGIVRGFNMFENIEWLMNNYYNNERIIVWTHNFHIRKRQTLTSKILGIKSVGYWLHHKYPNDFYSIGFYAGSGKFATQLRVELNINITKKYHLETLLCEALESDLFLPLDVKNQNTENKMWFKRKWLLLESGFSGFSPKVVYPQDYYDAIIFIRKVNSPNYFKRSENIKKI